MTGKITELLKNGNVFVPKLLLLNYKNLHITDSELILLIYLLGENEIIIML